LNANWYQALRPNGSNLTEAILMAVDAASGWMQLSLEDGQDIPSASPTDSKF